MPINLLISDMLEHFISNTYTAFNIRGPYILLFHSYLYHEQSVFTTKTGFQDCSQFLQDAPFICKYGSACRVFQMYGTASNCSLFTSLFSFKVCHKITQSFILERFRNPHHNFSLRDSFLHSYNTPLEHVMVQQFNKLPFDIRSIPTYKRYKTTLNQYILSRSI